MTMCLNCRPNTPDNPVSADATKGVTTLAEAAGLLDALDMSYDAIDLISVAEYLNRNN